MKKKRLINGGLLLCLIVIWSFVIKKVFFNNKEPLSQESEVYEAYEISKEIKEKKDTIVLTTLINPFTLRLDSYKKPRQVQNNNEVPIRRASTSKKESPKPWPSVFYFGFVGSSRKTNHLGLLKINQKLTRLREGENIQGLTIKKLYVDSVIVIKDGKEKSFIRKR